MTSKKGKASSNIQDSSIIAIIFSRLKGYCDWRNNVTTSCFVPKPPGNRAAESRTNDNIVT